MKYETIVLREYISPVLEELDEFKTNLYDTQSEVLDQSKDIENLINRIYDLSNEMGHDIHIEFESEEKELEKINIIILEKLDNLTEYKDDALTRNDILIGSLAGIVGVVLDVFMVGTPNIEKIYQKGEVFNGSKLTEMIRNLSESSISPFLKTLEGKFNVPYDLSISKDGLLPDNHRLKSLSHDPFFGLFFSLFDFVFKTTTYINKNGNLVIKPNITKSYEPINLYKSVYYFIGHILSDVSTARGIPIPGFFLTQVFTEEKFGSDIAENAEQMYKNGYDLRHLTSMQLAYEIKKLVINMYLDLTNDAVEESMLNAYHKESYRLQRTIKKEKINLIANSITVTGNVVKFLAPPNSGNPAALNVVEWYKFLHSSINNLNRATRSKDVEQIDHNRDTIDSNWDKLLKM